MRFPDQKHIDHVRDALWSRTSRASVMVGSGFSKHALPAWPDAGELPEWHELAQEMFSRLHPGNPGGCQPSSTCGTSDRFDALSLAQKYKDEFKRSGLHQFLQQRVRDLDFNPGEFHGRLLKLPWRDIFTTNWDTLLERARFSVPERPYSVVHNKDEIPLLSQPRIFKLHGSLDGHYPLIAAEEDYRAYPVRHAPFVNTVQQAMMETVFCLVGFSGNDPNFLRWSGWVNENLGDDAPPIYLVGWFELSADARDHLQSRNVTAIDLAALPEASNWPDHLRHKNAISWVLNRLEDGRPYDVTSWPVPDDRGLSQPSDRLQTPSPATSSQPIKEEWHSGGSNHPRDIEKSVRETLDTWAHNRKVYPGWLLVPLEVRSTLISITRSWQPTILEHLNNQSPVDRLTAIRELIWRHEVTLEPITSDLDTAALDALGLIDCGARTVNGNSKPQLAWSEIRAAWREVALALVTSARYQLDEDMFLRRVEAATSFEEDDPDTHHRIHHERCLWAVWSLDFETLDRVLEDWITENCDPIWTLKKAALLSEAGNEDAAKIQIERATEVIRRIPDNEHSVAGPSREGWALWSSIDNENRLEVFKRWAELASLRCDAYSEKIHMTRALTPKNDSRNPPDFDLGSLQVTSITYRSHNPSAEAHRAIRISEVAGLPLATPAAFPPRAVVADLLEMAADNLAESEPELAMRLVLRACTYDRNKTLMRVLSRTRVALIEEDSARRLAADCTRLIKHGLRQDRLEQVRVSLEVLSRLVLRLDTESVEEVLAFALELYRDREHAVTSHVLASDPLNNLLERSWAALPGDQRTLRVLDLLGAPVIGVDGFTAQIEEKYPDPGTLVMGDPETLLPDRNGVHEANWRDVVNLVVRALRADGEPRRRASTRLLPLAAKGILTDAESIAVADALWAAEHTRGDGLPENTSLYDGAFLVLPEPESGLAAQRFRRRWLSGNAVKSRVDVTKSKGSIRVTLGERPRDCARLEDALWNVGNAIHLTRSLGGSIELTDLERDHLIDLVSQWSRVPLVSHDDPFMQSEILRWTTWGLEGTTPILPEIDIPIGVGETYFKKLMDLTESGIPAYGPVGSLIRIIPDLKGDVVDWLRIGLSSGSRDMATSAVAGLTFWMQDCSKASPREIPPPLELVRELGLIIAGRRKEPLEAALQAAIWVFEEGCNSLRDPIRDFALKGLNYLADELRYDREQHDYVNVPKLRQLCARLALSMHKAGLGGEPAVVRWQRIASEDPLPEVRLESSNSLGHLG